MLQVCSDCSQAVGKWCSHCLFPVVVTSLKQSVNNLYWQAWRHYQTNYQTCYKPGCSNKSAGYSHDITRLLQGWRHKVVTILLYHDCIEFVGTILQQVCQYQQGWRFLQVVNSLFHTWDKQWEHMLLTACMSVADLLQDVRFLRRVYHSTELVQCPVYTHKTHKL
jgi:hypothetical protein